MSMLALAPLSLLGLFLLALPWWLHRLQTEIPQTESFPSTMLLEAAKKRIHVRKQLRYLALLLTRILFLLLLVLAFARPALLEKDAAITDDTEIHLIVIDASASMAAPGNIGAARSTAERIIRQLPDDSAAQIIRAVAGLETLTALSNDKDTLSAAVKSIETNPVAVNYAAVMTGLDQLMQAETQNYQLHFISDFQSSAMPSRFADLVPTGNGRNYTLSLYPTRVSQTGNRAIESVQQEQGGLRIVVNNWQSDAESITLAVRVSNEPELTTTIEAPADGRSSAFFNNLLLQEGNNKIVISIKEDDALPADNTYRFAIDQNPAQPVLLLSSDPDGQSVTYLNAIFAEDLDSNANTSSTGFTLQTENINNFDTRRLERYRWVIIDDIGSVQGNLATELSQYLDAGGAIFAASGPRSRTLQQIPLAGQKVSPRSFEQQPDFQTISTIDTSHPVLNSLSGWSTITVAEHIKVEAESTDQVLLGLSNGNPLLIEPRREKGRFIWLSSSLDNNWNNLPLKPLYVALMGEVANYLSNTQRLETQQFAGQVLGLSADAGNYGQLLDPQGRRILGLGEKLNSDALRLAQTGFYELINASGNQLIGVNIDPSESNLTGISNDKIEQWQQAATRIQANASNNTQAINSEEKINELWLLVFAMASVMLIIESILANFILRRANRSGTA